MRGERKKGLFLLFIFTLAFLVPDAHAALPWYSDIYLWVGLAVSISAAFIGMAYMVARLFQLSVLEAWVKIEIQELMAGIIIAVFCVALVATANSAASFLAGSPTPDIGSFAINAVSTIYSDGSGLYRAIGDVYFSAAKIASYSFTAGITPGVVSFSISQSPGAGLYPLVTSIGGAMDSIATLLLFLAAQQSFIIFFVNASAIMLPVGIFMRCFSLTRKVGGVVLAAVIASAVIYPASFAISNEVYKPYSNDLHASTNNVQLAAAHLDPGNPPLAGIVCNPAALAFVESPVGAIAALTLGQISSRLGEIGGGIGSLAAEVSAGLLSGETGWELTVCTWLGPAAPACDAIIELLFPHIKSLFPIALFPFLNSYAGGGITGYGSTAMADAYLQPVAAYVLPAASKFGVLVVVFSLIPIIISLVMLRSLAITFGGEPQLYGITKLV